MGVRSNVESATSKAPTSWVLWQSQVSSVSAKCDSDGNYNLRRQPSPAEIEINMHPDGLTGFLDLQSQFRLVSSPHVKKKASQIAFWAMLNPVIFLRGTNPSTKPDGFLQSESKVKVFIANFPTH